MSAITSLTEMHTASMHGLSIDDGPAASTSRFWALDVAKKLPYAIWALGDVKSQVSDRYFARERFFAYKWDLHFFWVDEINPEKPLILLPEAQVRGFIRTIRAAFPGSPIDIPSERDWNGLVLDFGLFPGIEPFEMAPVRSAEQLQQSIAALHVDRSRYTERFGEHLMTTLKKAVDSTIKCHNAKKNKAREEARQERVRGNAEALVKLQKFLGLRAPNDESLENVSLLNTDRRVPWTWSPAPVFICVDIEAHERKKNVITEIGICTLDVADVAWMAPGHLGKDWRNKFRARHVRVREYLHHVNKDFVKGHPDKFQFGNSEVVPKADIRRLLANSFKPPYGARKHHDQANMEERPIVLVGHDILSDIRFMKSLGYDVVAQAKPVCTLDSNSIYAYLSGNSSGQNIKLANALESVDIDAWFLHNGGNDAYYTLALCIALAFAHRQGKRLGDGPSPVVPESSPWQDGAPESGHPLVEI